MSEATITGRVWLLCDSEGKLIEDIDTDQIFHNAHLHITEIAEMGAFALGNLKGWEDFPRKAARGDIILAGRNFGAGSSRQQAVDCFRALGIGALLAPSFGAIYFRNAVNSGFPVLRCSGLDDYVSKELLRTGGVVVIDPSAGKMTDKVSGEIFVLEPMSRVQSDILEAGNLFSYAKKQG